MIKFFSSKRNETSYYLRISFLKESTTSMDDGNLRGGARRSNGVVHEIGRAGPEHAGRYLCLASVPGLRIARWSAMHLRVLSTCRVAIDPRSLSAGTFSL